MTAAENASRVGLGWASSGEGSSTFTPPPKPKQNQPPQTGGFRRSSPRFNPFSRGTVLLPCSVDPLPAAGRGSGLPLTSCLCCAKGRSPTDQRFSAPGSSRGGFFPASLFSEVPCGSCPPAPLLSPARSSAGPCAAGSSACRPGGGSSPAAWPPPSPAGLTCGRRGQASSSHRTPPGQGVPPPRVALTRQGKRQRQAGAAETARRRLQGHRHIRTSQATNEAFQKRAAAN